MTHPELKQYIDHTLLDQIADETAVRGLCSEARKHHYHAACVNPVWVALAKEELAGSGVAVCSVAGFPLGATKTEMKVSEAMLAVADGATEIDMVANIGWLLSGHWSQAEAEIRKVRRHLPDNVLLKVIIEAGRLSQAQMQRAVQVVIDGGAEFVKSGTGFFGPVTLLQVQTLVDAARGRIKTKAAGGIRTRAFAIALVEAGAARLGTSASRTLLEVAK